MAPRFAPFGTARCLPTPEQCLGLPTRKYLILILNLQIISSHEARLISSPFFVRRSSTRAHGVRVIVTTLRGQVPSQNVHPAPITPRCLFRKDRHGMRPAERWVSLGWVLARGGSKHESHLSQLKEPVPGRKRERLLGGALRGRFLGWPQNTGAGKIGPLCSQSLEDTREQVDPENRRNPCCLIFLFFIFFFFCISLFETKAQLTGYWCSGGPTPGSDFDVLLSN